MIACQVIVNNRIDQIEKKKLLAKNWKIKWKLSINKIILNNREELIIFPE